MNKNLFKSIAAVLAGFVTVFVLSTVTDLMLEKLGVFPPPTEGLFITWMLILALAYRTAFTIFGGYITAKLAPSRPMKHVLVLASTGTVAATVGLIVTWGKGLGPEWYPITLALLAFPSVWLGGKLRIKSK